MVYCVPILSIFSTIFYLMALMKDFYPTHIAVIGLIGSLFFLILGGSIANQNNTIQTLKKENAEIKQQLNDLKEQTDNTQKSLPHTLFELQYSIKEQKKEITNLKQEIEELKKTSTNNTTSEDSKKDE